MTPQDAPDVGLVDHSPSTETFLDDVIAGLSAEPKTLPCKYFYDERGSQLFDAICELDEYYLTRTELEIMRRYAGEMAAAIGPEAMLIELGSGSSTKTEILLDHLQALSAYVPVDISREHLRHTAESLAARYHDLQVLPVSADFTESFDLPSPACDARRNVVYFPGSTIGNFTAEAARELLELIAILCGENGALLIGVDLKKDPQVLEAAYDDCEGTTAAFNLNILRRINRELDADFVLNQFRHRAKYNPVAGRVEMFLISQRAQAVHLGGETIRFEQEEPICTEHSHKYDVQEFARMAQTVGLKLNRQWTDSKQQMAVLYLEVTSPDERAL